MNWYIKKFKELVTKELFYLSLNDLNSMDDVIRILLHQKQVKKKPAEGKSPILKDILSPKRSMIFIDGIQDYYKLQQNIIEFR